MLTTAIIFVALLSVLVFVHELGHFLAAIKAGVRVEEFGFGFPPRLWGVKRGHTIYSINWIPLGGFVRIKGEAGEHAHDHDSFPAKSLPARAFIICAGVIMNVAFAWLLLSVGYLVGLPQIIEGQSSGRQVANAEVHVYDVIKGSPAAAAGLEPGDTLVSLDGQHLADIDAIIAYTSARGGAPIVFHLRRGQTETDRTVTPVMMKDTGRPGIGIALFETGLVSYPWYQAPAEGAKATGDFLKEITGALYGFFHDLVVTRQVSQDLSGPVGIAVLTGEVASLGFRYVIQFAALLSLNLAVVNILPLPALDGGRLLFIVIEALRRRAMDRKIEALAHNIGFAALMLIVVFVTYRDLLKYGDHILQSLAALVGGR